MKDVKKEYRVYKLAEKDGESVLELRTVSTGLGRPNETVYDDFDTEEEAVRFGAEKYGYSRFTVIPVYHEMDEWEKKDDLL